MSVLSNTEIVAREQTVRVWLMDDNARFRNLLAQILDMDSGIECARQFSSPAAVLAALGCETPPDVILLDIEMGAPCHVGNHGRDVSKRGAFPDEASGGRDAVRQIRVCAGHGLPCGEI